MGSAAAPAVSKAKEAVSASPASRIEFEGPDLEAKSGRTAHLNRQNEY